MRGPNMIGFVQIVLLLFGIIPVVSPADTHLGCTDDVCYQFFVSDVTWDVAKANCKAVDGELLTIKDAATQSAVEQLLAGHADFTEKVWLSIHLEYNDRSGTDTTCQYMTEDTTGTVILGSASCDQVYGTACLNKPAGGCWPSDTIFGSVCGDNFIYNDDPLTWREARRKCSDIDQNYGYIGETNLAEEVSQFLSDIVVDEKIWVPYTTWSWRDGSELTYDNLLDTNIYMGLFRCMFYDASLHKWSAGDCEIEHSYICEIELPVASTISDTTFLTEDVSEVSPQDTTEATDEGGSDYAGRETSSINDEVMWLLVGCVGGALLLVTICLLLCLWICNRGGGGSSDAEKGADPYETLDEEEGSKNEPSEGEAEDNSNENNNPSDQIDDEEEPSEDQNKEEDNDKNDDASSD